MHLCVLPPWIPGSWGYHTNRTVQNYGHVSRGQLARPEPSTTISSGAFVCVLIFRTFQCLFHKDVPYRSPFPEKFDILSGFSISDFQADARRPSSKILKTKEQILHITSVLYLLLVLQCLISGRCSTETALISFPDILRQTFQKSRPAVPAASRKSFGNAA